MACHLPQFHLTSKPCTKLYTVCHQMNYHCSIMSGMQSCHQGHQHTIAAIKLASAELWSQLWFDCTTHKQITFTVLVIGLMFKPELLDPAVMSSYIFLDNKKSETKAEGEFHLFSFSMSSFFTDLFCACPKFVH